MLLISNQNQQKGRKLRTMELKLGQTYKVKVIKLIQYGCIVKLEDNSTELIHLSQISNQFVNNVEEFVNVGDMFDAKGVSGTKNPVQLSLKHLNLVCMCDKSKQLNRADSCSLHTSKPSDTFRLVESRCSMRDVFMEEHKYDDDNYVNSHKQSRSHSKKHRTVGTDGYGDDVNYLTKQRRKNRRTNNNCHRKDKYFD